MKFVEYRPAQTGFTEMDLTPRALETWAWFMDFAPLTGDALAELYRITPYVDWDEAEDDDGVAPYRPPTRPPSTEWAEAPPPDLHYDEDDQRWYP